MIEHAHAAGLRGELLGLLNRVGRLQQQPTLLGPARESLTRALAIFEQRLGPRHRNVASVLRNLCALLQEMGDEAGAKACFQRAEQTQTPE